MLRAIDMRMRWNEMDYWLGSQRAMLTVKKVDFLGLNLRSA